MADPDPTPISGERLETVMSEHDIREAIHEMAQAVVQRENQLQKLIVLGIQKGGVPIARALAAKIALISGIQPLEGTVDVSFYRDDLGQRLPRPEATYLPGDVTGRDILLVDSVLFSGRTVIAACDAIKDYGRPARIRLAVLVDRGHRELPIAPDYVGKFVPTELAQKVRVRPDFVAVVTPQEVAPL